MNHRILVSIVAAVCVAGPAGPVCAQSFPHLSVDVSGTTLGIDGGERPNTGSSTGPIEIGKVHTAVFTKLPTMCGFGVARGLLAGGISAWSTEITPISVDDDVVTFRFRWARIRDEGRDASGPSGELLLKMKPGQSMPVDIVPLSPAVTLAYDECGVRATALRVGVNAWTRVENDRRLVATELWLVERLPNGQERSQALTIRGLFNRATPFYFDSIVDGGVSLDFHGEVTIAPADAGMRLTLTTRSRVVQGDIVSTSIPEGALMRARTIDSTMLVAPGEVVAIELPRLSENAAAAFLNHRFSIRVRSRQLR